MTMTETPEAARARIAALLGEVFAPWVQALGLEALELLPDGARFRLPGGDHLTRGGGEGPGAVCGQALAAAADTAAAATLAGLNGRFRNCATTGLRIEFLRAAPAGRDLIVTVVANSNGRTMANLRIEFHGEDGRLAATANASFFYLEP